MWYVDLNQRGPLINNFVEKYNIFNIQSNSTSVRENWIESYVSTMVGYFLRLRTFNSRKKTVTDSEMTVTVFLLSYYVVGQRCC